MSQSPWAAVAASALLCASCAGPAMQVPGVDASELATEQRQQQISLIQSYAAQSARLDNVAHRVLVANRAECKGAVAPRIGWQTIARPDIGFALRELITDALHLDGDKTTVISVVAGGPAAQAGIGAGDVLVAINKRRIPAFLSRDWLANFLRWNGDKPISVEFERQGKPHTRTVTPVMGCNIPVMLTLNAGPNAFTDGSMIVIQNGLLRLTQTDAELAAVFSHELAHVTLQHIAKQAYNRSGGAVGGSIGGFVAGYNQGLATAKSSGANTRAITQSDIFKTDFEREADYVGAYYMARAGYDVAGAENFWRTLAQENPQQIFYAGLHPTAPERVVLLQKTAQEIAEKKKRNLPLNPETKSSQATAPTFVAGGGQ